MTATTAGPTVATSPPEATLGRWVALSAVVTVGAIALPFIFLRPEPLYFHLVFHLIGIALCTLGIWVHRRFRQQTTRRALRALTWVCTAALTLWLVGHAGELVTVLRHGGAHATAELFENPVHSFFANIAVPAWMLTVLSSLVLLITTGIVMIRRTRPSSGRPTGQGARRGPA